MTDIDYAALAKAAHDTITAGWEVSWDESSGTARANFLREVRAVVAALREQGFAVVRSTDLNFLYAKAQGQLGLSYIDGPTKQRVEEALNG
jgi:hypothetical protein